METAKKILKEKGIKDTLFLNDKWVKGGLSDLLKEHYNNKSYSKRVSSDGIFFYCEKCSYEPEMIGNKDDLIKMNYCPDCGCKFGNSIIVNA